MYSTDFRYVRRSSCRCGWWVTYYIPWRFRGGYLYDHVSILYSISQSYWLNRLPVPLLFSHSFNGLGFVISYEASLSTKLDSGSCSCPSAFPGVYCQHHNYRLDSATTAHIAPKSRRILLLTYKGLESIPSSIKRRHYQP